MCWKAFRDSYDLFQWLWNKSYCSTRRYVWFSFIFSFSPILQSHFCFQPMFRKLKKNLSELHVSKICPFEATGGRALGFAQICFWISLTAASHAKAVESHDATPRASMRFPCATLKGEWKVPKICFRSATKVTKTWPDPLQNIFFIIGNR